jgi:hypothetical protein
MLNGTFYAPPNDPRISGANLAIGCQGPDRICAEFARELPTGCRLLPRLDSDSIPVLQSRAQAEACPDYRPATLKDLHRPIQWADVSVDNFGSPWVRFIRKMSQRR